MDRRIKPSKVGSLNGLRFHNAFLAGTEALERRRDYLNRINVFPVPDGDTGDNMASTLRYIARETEVSRSLALTCNSMAEAALMGSRGNSGLILAQYLYGFSRALREEVSINTVTFAESLVKAVPFAEEALNRPLEGTILTVLRDWAEHVYSLSRAIGDFALLLPASISAAQRSLMDTPNRLEVLSRNGVVDAGAQGFVDFLQGISDFLEKGDLRKLGARAVRVSIDPSEVHLEEEMPSFRYCTEAILEGRGLSRKGLMSELSSWGDSVIVGGHGEKFRAHIHTDRPDKLFEALSLKGTFHEQKVDDMFRQVQIKSNRLSSIALLTDSACDLPSSLMDEYQIHMMPLKISLDGSIWLDKLTIKPDRIYSILSNTDKSMTTSQPGLGDLADRYAFLLSHYDQVVAIHLSSHLSGTWNTSVKAASLVDPSRITVIDSRNLCSGLGLIVLEAAEAISRGASMDQVIGLVDDIIPRTRIFVSLNTLQYMVRGGRISPIKGWLAKALNLKPIISIDAEGRGVHYGNACSERGNLSRILRVFEDLSHNRGIRKYAVVHANADQKALELAERLSDSCGKDPAYLMEISPVIGINSGPGSVAVSVIHEE